MKRTWLVGLGLVAAVWVAAQEDPAAQRAGAVSVCVSQFWTSLVSGDADGLAETIDFPVVFQEIDAEGKPGGRFVVEQRDWGRYRQHFPATPLGPDKASVTLSDQQTSWLGDGTAVVTFQVEAKLQDLTIEGRFMCLVVNHDGWKIAVATTPA